MFSFFMLNVFVFVSFICICKFIKLTTAFGMKYKYYFSGILFKKEIFYSAKEIFRILIKKITDLQVQIVAQHNTFLNQLLLLLFTTMMEQAIHLQKIQNKIQDNLYDNMQCGPLERSLFTDGSKQGCSILPKNKIQIYFSENSIFDFDLFLG